jgi:DNA-binding GntR family transcriptional regulator
MDPKSQIAELGPLPRNALRHDVVVRLMASIFQGTLPADTRLIIRKMAEQMGVSATPIREALVELESLGIVQFSHHRGAVVKPFGRQELRDIYHVRRILDAEAARCACGRIPHEELQTLRDEMCQLLGAVGGESPEWSRKAMATDQRFHELITTYCNNPRLSDEVKRYNSLMQTMREIVGNRRRAQQRALEEHMPIVDAILAGDADEAAAAMARHVDGAMESVETVMFQPK